MKSGSAAASNDHIFYDEIIKGSYCLLALDQNGLLSWKTNFDSHDNNDAPIYSVGLEEPLVVTKDLVFVSTESEIYCVRQSDGKIMWKVGSLNNPFEPLVAGNVLYLVLSSPNTNDNCFLAAYNTDTGQSLWMHKFDFKIKRLIAHEGALYALVVDNTSTTEASIRRVRLVKLIPT